MKEGTKSVVGTRVTRAAAHVPVEEVKRRMKLDPPSFPPITAWDLPRLKRQAKEDAVMNT